MRETPDQTMQGGRGRVDGLTRIGDWGACLRATPRHTRDEGGASDRVQCEGTSSRPRIIHTVRKIRRVKVYQMDSRNPIILNQLDSQTGNCDQMASYIQQARH